MVLNAQPVRSMRESDDQIMLLGSGAHSETDGAFVSALLTDKHDLRFLNIFTYM